MAKAQSKAQKPNHLLVDYLEMLRETILNKWRTPCLEAPNLHGKIGFPREEFNDQVPALPNILAQRLRGETK